MLRVIIRDRHQPCLDRCLRWLLALVHGVEAELWYQGVEAELWYPRVEAEHQRVEAEHQRVEAEH